MNMNRQRYIQKKIVTQNIAILKSIKVHHKLNHYLIELNALLAVAENILQLFLLYVYYL